MAKIHVFKAGYCTHPACVAMKGEGIRSCKFPAQVFLLESHNHYWLWDTGYANHFMDATASGIFKLYRQITPVYFDSQEAIIAQLKALGISSQDLSGLIISHFHADHIAGLKDFIHTPMITSEIGWKGVKRKEGISALIKGFIPSLIPNSFEDHLTYIESLPQVQLDPLLFPLNQGYELPNSQGEIILVSLPGHALGHYGAVILTEDGWQLLASDAAWSYKNYRNNQWPMKVAGLIMDDVHDFYQTLNILKQLDQNNIPILLSHEDIQCD